MAYMQPVTLSTTDKEILQNILDVLEQQLVVLKEIREKLEIQVI